MCSHKVQAAGVHKNKWKQHRQSLPAEIFFTLFSATWRPVGYNGGEQRGQGGSALTTGGDELRAALPAEVFTLLGSSFFIWTMGRDGVREADNY